MGKKVLKVLLALGVLIVIGIIISVWMVWKRPLKVDARFSRFALGKLGFEKMTIPSPDGRMTVWVGGEGQCMVLLHGAGDQAGTWARMVPPLLEDYKLVIPDLPGHWKSDPRKGPIGVDQLLSGVELVMDSICAGEEAVLVGNSLGAWLSMLYAHDYPAHVARMVLINGGAITNVNPAINLFPETREEARETMKALMGPATLPLPDFVLDDVIRHARVGPAGRFGDDLWTLDVAQRLLDGLPRARLHTVHGCGHVPHRECPDKTLDALQAALALPPPESNVEEGVVEGEGT
ncbi:MAG: alpha/beta fold hydrolase [Acidobacteria bacterium]|nr:alpha/beta fold hydrolase [Candidatus Sulfomarinibacter kjeldsenii]